jgi:carbon starvation protein
VLTGVEAWTSRYASWGAAKGLGAKVGNFVDGSANFLQAMGIGSTTAVALMGVLVASFAGTTLDTACRLQRYVVQELAGTFLREKNAASVSTLHPARWLSGRHGATVFAVVLAAFVAALPVPGQTWSWESAGKGGLILWPMFGATNQLLGGLAFLVVVFWLRRRGLSAWFAVLPMVFMLILPAWAMALQVPDWLAPAEGSRNWVLIVIALATLALETWLVIEALLLWPRARGLLEEALPPLPPRGAVPNEGGRSC